MRPTPPETINLTCPSEHDSNKGVSNDENKQIDVQRQALRLLGEKCPRLRRLCYWAGSAAMAIEELHHRTSFDLDFHTRQALKNVRPIMSEIQHAFPGQFEVIQAPDEFGSSFRGILTLPGGAQITVEVMSNYEDVLETDLVPSTTAPGILRVSLFRYLADKIQCVAERAEARDLVDILAVLHRHPEMEPLARRLLMEQDALLLAERLLSWTDERITADLEAYVDVSPEEARQTRDMLLQWLKSASREEPQS
jgi:hypothetical protein